MNVARPTALALMLACGTVAAEFKDGNKLLSQIRGDTIDYVNAVGYITGVFDTLRSVTHCAPGSVSAGQVTDMVRAHLEANPSVRHITADQHIAYVLKATWPCPERRNRGDSL